MKWQHSLLKSMLLVRKIVVIIHTDNILFNMESFTILDEAFPYPAMLLIQKPSDSFLSIGRSIMKQGILLSLSS